MEWVETIGKTIAEAKEQALDQLGVHEEDADFEVLEEPKQGLFGRVRGEARVRARVRPTQARQKVDRRDRKRTDKADKADKARRGTESLDQPPLLQPGSSGAEGGAAATARDQGQPRAPGERAKAAVASGKARTGTIRRDTTRSNDTPRRPTANARSNSWMHARSAKKPFDS